MGNKTDPTKRASRERLAYIETLAYWRGWVRRSDITERFKISVPQASADIAAYNKLSRGALIYNAKLKRYAGAHNMPRCINKPQFSDALQMLRDLQPSHLGMVAHIDLPGRLEAVEILRPIVMAVFIGNAIEIQYYTVNSGKVEWRWICPRAFAHDGYRWHLRAWCVSSKAYKDFVFGRIANTRKSKPAETLPPDNDWDQFATIKFKAHSSLTPTQRVAIERDFGMVKGVARIQIRKAMLFYALLYLGLEPAHPMARRLEIAN